MSRSRRLGLVFGTALVFYGLLVAVAPGLARGFDTPELLTVVGLAALIAGGMAVRARLRATNRETETPTPERRQSFATPGDEFDRQLAALVSRRRLRGAREHRAVRDRLDELAISVLVRAGDSETVARDRLARGTWTDDPYAAAFFAKASATDIPLEARLRAAFSAEPRMKKRARHAVCALARIADGERER